MIDGNMRALDRYEHGMVRHDHYESLFVSEMEAIIQQVEELANQARALVNHMEYEYNLDFSDQAKDMLSEAIR